MKIKWLYTILSLLTLLLLAGSSAFIFYDGSTSIETQRKDNEGQLRLNSLFINFVANYKSLINSEYTSVAQFTQNKKSFTLDLEELEKEVNHEQLIQFQDFRQLTKALEKLTHQKIQLNQQLEKIERESNLAWSEIQETIVSEVTARVNNGEEFLPEFKKKLDSWAENISLLNKLKQSIDVSYVNKDDFVALEGMIDFSRWLMNFKSKELETFDNLENKKVIVFDRVNQLKTSQKIKEKLKAMVVTSFLIFENKNKVKANLVQVTRELRTHRDHSVQLFEKDIFPKWQEYISERYDQRITERYRRLKKVVTAVSLGGGLIILTMLFVFLKIFPHLKKLEEKAKQVAQGNYEARFQHSIPNSEIGNVMHAFNDMSVQISQYLKELEKKESEKLKLNDSIQKIKQISQLGEFSAKMAHELKNPISILNFCLSDAIESIKSEDYEFAKVELEKCSVALDRIKMTASKLGAKSNYSKKEKVDISLLFNEIEKMYQALLLKENIELHVENLLNHSIILAPRVELTGAISNLIDNALDHIRGHDGISRKIQISLHHENEFIVMEIKNSGSKIENTESIFNHFYTSKESELRGLGLIIVKDVIDECGGEINYYYVNELNTFQAKLPKA